MIFFLKMMSEYFHHHLPICIAAFLCILMIILVLILHTCLCLHPRKHDTNVSDSERSQASHTTRIHQVNPLNHHHQQNLIDERSSFFSWADHPHLVAEAAENGWSRFTFKAVMHSSSNSMETDHHTEPGNVVFGWEVCEGSEYKIQKIQANPGLSIAVEKSFDSPNMALSVVRTGLPLPGPCLGSSSFPQEAYFEIVILSCDNDENILDDSSDKRVNTQLCVGFTISDPLPWRSPGKYHRSVGFNSNGSIYLNGTKLILQAEAKAWGKANKTIGCGYNPSEKMVFFTVDSSLVHEVHCEDEAFGFPLYPALALNTGATVLINLGQNPFKFLPGNVLRNPNPCLARPVLESVLEYEDSEELFSIGSINSQGQIRSGTFKSNKATEPDLESGSDCFEIPLDGS